MTLFLLCCFCRYVKQVRFSVAKLLNYASYVWLRPHLRKNFFARLACLTISMSRLEFSLLSTNLSSTNTERITKTCFTGVIVLAVKSSAYSTSYVAWYSKLKGVYDSDWWFSYRYWLFTIQESFAMPGYYLTTIDRSGIDKKNICPKCDELLKEAVQTIACGHRYCKACVEDILR